MKKILKITAVLFLCFGVFAPVSKAETDFARVSGSSRYDTSVKVSEVIYESTAKNAVLVSGENYPDGLTGGVLASTVDGPVLLTEKNALPATAENALRILKPETIYILGGEGSVSRSVEEAASRFGKIVRIAGKDRFDTAVKTARLIYDLPGSNHRYIGIANGMNFPDALSAGGYLSNTKIPLALTSKTTLYDGISDIIDEARIRRGIIIGGEGQLPDEIIPDILSVGRLEGKDRYETSVAVAEEGFDNAKIAIITSGEVYPDALSAAPLSNYLDAPILLASKNGLSPEVVDYIKSHDIEKIIAVGGKASLPDEIFKVLGIDTKVPVQDPDAAPVG